MKKLMLENKGKPCTLGECPAGFFFYDDWVWLKTQPMRGTYRVFGENGHKFQGYNTYAQRDALMVQPLISVWFVEEENIENPYQSIGHLGVKWEGEERLRAEFPTKYIAKFMVVFEEKTAVITDNMILEEGGKKNTNELPDVQLLELLRVVTNIGNRLVEMGYTVNP